MKKLNKFLNSNIIPTILSWILIILVFVGPLSVIIFCIKWILTMLGVI